MSTNPAPTAPSSAAAPFATIPSSSALALFLFTIFLLFLLALHRGSIVVMALPLGRGSPRLPSKLHAHLPLQNLFATKLSNSTFGLLLGREVDEGIADGTTAAWVGRDGRGFT